jgi:hypothetical protein
MIGLHKSKELHMQSFFSSAGDMVSGEREEKKERE